MYFVRLACPGPTTSTIQLLCTPYLHQLACKRRVPQLKMRNAVFSLLAISLTALLAFWLIFDPFQGDWTVPAFHFSVTHTVLFQFKEDADPQAVRDVRLPYRLHLIVPTADIGHDAWEQVCDRMMALRAACVNPSTLQPYIKSLTGGRDNSPEGLQVSLKQRPTSIWAAMVTIC